MLYNYTYPCFDGQLLFDIEDNQIIKDVKYKGDHPSFNGVFWAVLCRLAKDKRIEEVMTFSIVDIYGLAMELHEQNALSHSDLSDLEKLENDELGMCYPPLSQLHFALLSLIGIKEQMSYGFASLYGAEDNLLCPCFGTKNSAISKLVNEAKSKPCNEITLALVNEKLNAGIACGECSNELKLSLAEAKYDHYPIPKLNNEVQPLYQNASPVDWLNAIQPVLNLWLKGVGMMDDDIVVDRIQMPYIVLKSRIKKMPFPEKQFLSEFSVFSESHLKISLEFRLE